MAVRTQLQAEEVGALLAEFGAGPVRGSSGISAGSVNSNYRVDTDAGPLFLRVNEGKSEAEVRYELAVIDHLRRAGVATPRPMVARDGRRFAAHHGALVSVFEWAPGRILTRAELRPAHTAQVGAALARLHLAGADFPDPWPGRYTFEAVVARLESLADGRDPAVRAALPALREEAAWLPARRRADLPGGLIHQDLFRDNVLFEGDRLAAVLDFEQACAGSYCYDLAVCLLDWCFDEAFVFPRARALIDGYVAVRRPAEAELASLFVEARAAALRFTVTRITDVHLGLPAGAADGPPLKDFRRYLRRLQALRELGEEGFGRELRQADT